MATVHVLALAALLTALGAVPAQAQNEEDRENGDKTQKTTELIILWVIFVITIVGFAIYQYLRYKKDMQARARAKALQQRSPVPLAQQPGSGASPHALAVHVAAPVAPSTYPPAYGAATAAAGQGLSVLPANMDARPVFKVAGACDSDWRLAVTGSAKA
jgi:hypothetical protein